MDEQELRGYLERLARATTADEVVAIAQEVVSRHPIRDAGRERLSKEIARRMDELWSP
jgi:hypothetical protein